MKVRGIWEEEEEEEEGIEQSVEGLTAMYNLQEPLPQEIGTGRGLDPCEMRTNGSKSCRHQASSSTPRHKLKMHCISTAEGRRSP